MGDKRKFTIWGHNLSSLFGTRFFGKAGLITEQLTTGRVRYPSVPWWAGDGPRYWIPIDREVTLIGHLPAVDRCTWTSLPARTIPSDPCNTVLFIDLPYSLAYGTRIAYAYSISRLAISLDYRNPPPSTVIEPEMRLSCHFFLLSPLFLRFIHTSLGQ